jgi:hypothetical protein
MLGRLPGIVSASARENAVDNLYAVAGLESFSFSSQVDGTEVFA